MAAAGAAVNNTNKNIIFKNCTPFTNCKTEINTQVNKVQDNDIVMPKNYNYSKYLKLYLIKYSDACSKTSGSLWQYYKDEAALDNNNCIIDFPANNNNSISLKLKEQITGKTGNGGTKDVEIMVLLKYLKSNFWRTLEMPLINCEISLQLK